MKTVFEKWNRFVKETLAALNENSKKEESQAEESKVRD